MIPIKEETNRAGRTAVSRDSPCYSGLKLVQKRSVFPILHLVAFVTSCATWLADKFHSSLRNTNTWMSSFRAYHYIITLNSYFSGLSSDCSTSKSGLGFGW